ncbi:MAG: DEAD/DEAH box helicase, partial [Tepidisphaeraceae bacterium]
TKASGSAIFIPDERQVIWRDRAGERAALARLDRFGCRADYDYRNDRFRRSLPANQLRQAVLELSAQGWHVEAEGKLYRTPGVFKVEVKSGIDWFDLHVAVDFGDGVSAPLPRLLEAVRKGSRTVLLDDGTIGILPEEWLARHAMLTNVGTVEGDTLRFTRAQAGFLDALLSAMPPAQIDTTFEQARERLRGFAGIAPHDAPGSFTGMLRPYQREGLGWMAFLREFGFGGCLADDMGLGKTVQVLAMLEQRRLEKAGPTLVVVPRSLIFNWVQEAQRFAPGLRLLDQTGTGRARRVDHFDDYDLVLTTYGTLRRDAGYLKDVDFDYIVLDESQAVKNAGSDSSKAARLLRGRHRLALSGTPIENHLGELWSLFEFLNPGLLGTASAFKDLGSSATANDPEARKLLADTLRPFILRRTKQQVAPELPPRTEQTIYCELEPAQRKLYDELKEHYRQTLLGSIETVGLGKTKFHVLEALLRLRQAACHPALIDKGRATDPSAKLDTLLDQLDEVLDEGHKALVFSQFTSLLAIVRSRLDAAGKTYEYLDGQTRDRQARVERFQTDPNCPLFLISLKAGGVGLNLTAADYVFLLDPWWNPAVEAQAIDRTHRIGQTRNVFAYRLIAKDTVEEKVLQLQKSKRDLADAILTADNALIASLKREDLELLLS